MSTTRAGSRRAGLVLAGVAAVISGVAVFVNSYGLKAVGDATVYTTGKNLVSAVALLVVVAAVARSASAPVLQRPTTRAHWLGLAVVGTFGGCVAFVLFFEGLARSSSVHAAFLQKTLVVWVALLAVPLLKERVGALQAGAIVLLVVGQAMSGESLGEVQDSVAATLQMPFGKGEALVLAAALIWSVEVVVAKRLLADLSSWTVALTRMVMGSVLLVGWVTVKGDLHQLVSLSAVQWRWVLVTGAILAAYVSTWFAALARAQAVDVTAVLVAAAIITALLNTLWKHQPIGPQLTGLAVVALGAAVVAAGALMRDRQAVPA
jgi:drug/metabolite transporter (DMT)-like permease